MKITKTGLWDKRNMDSLDALVVKLNLSSENGLFEKIEKISPPFGAIGSGDGSKKVNSQEVDAFDESCKTIILSPGFHRLSRLIFSMIILLMLLHQEPIIKALIDGF